MRITISGLPGSGTTTVAKLLSEELSVELISAGELFRQIAKEKKLPLEYFNKLAETDDDFDRQIDERQAEEAMKRENVIVESRLSGFFVPDADLKIWLKAPVGVRAKRIAHREAIAYEEALSAMNNRERSENKRYEQYYGINLNDLFIYDLVIDSSKWSERDIVGMIKVAVEGVKLREKINTDQTGVRF
ncbi:MAG: AAA family ATPase [Euryarchaeota archaeon]|nr:AAA family ATPase [Euryarchaeota archaeon]